MKEEGKATLALMKATYDVVQRDLGMGFITPDEMRLTINSRRGLVLELAAKGLSEREIAKLTKTSKTQVHRDLVPNGPKSGPKGTKVPKSGLNGGIAVKDVAAPVANDPIDELIDGIPDIDKEHPELSLGERWYNSFRHQAGDSIAMTAFWRKEFGDFLQFPITSEVVTLAKQAAEEWRVLANNLEEVLCDGSED